MCMCREAKPKKRDTVPKIQAMDRSAAQISNAVDVLQGCIILMVDDLQTRLQKEKDDITSEGQLSGTRIHVERLSGFDSRPVSYLTVNLIGCSLIGGVDARQGE